MTSSSVEKEKEDGGNYEIKQIGTGSMSSLRKGK